MPRTFTRKPLQLILNKRELIFDVISYTFIMLFVYTASNKLMTIDRFIKVLGKSPLLGHFNVVLAYAIPIVELGLSILLIANQTKRAGLFLSLLLIIVFTVYLVYMVNSGYTLPCLCGGVINLMSWKQHIFFNLVFIALAIAGLKLYRK